MNQIIVCYELSFRKDAIEIANLLQSLTSQLLEVDVPKQLHILELGSNALPIEIPVPILATIELFYQGEESVETCNQIIAKGINLIEPYKKNRYEVSLSVKFVIGKRIVF